MLVVYPVVAIPLVLANIGTTCAELAGVAAAAERLGRAAESAACYQLRLAG